MLFLIFTLTYSQRFLIEEGQTLTFEKGYWTQSRRLDSIPLGHGIMLTSDSLVLADRSRRRNNLP